MDSNEYFAKVIFVRDRNGEVLQYDNVHVVSCDFSTSIALSGDKAEVITFINKNLISVRAIVGENHGR